MGTVTAHTTSIRRDGDRRERGASLVEFALLAPVLFSLLLGMITGGLALSAKNSMTNAVREGGRLGATLPEGTDWSTDWAVDVRAQTVALAGGDLDTSEVCVQMVKVGNTPPVLGATACSGTLSPHVPATPSTAETGQCVVKVWASRGAELNALFFTRQLTLDAQAVGLYERSDCA